MEEAEKIICPTDIGREAQARVPSKLHQTREVCVWEPKCRAEETRISETLPRRRDVQQHEVRVFSQRHEICVSTSERKAHAVLISQLSPGKHDNQQREVRAFSQQRHETRVSKPKCESRVCFKEHELCISEPCAFEACVSELRRKVNIFSPTAKVRREVKSPHPQRLKVGLFDPPPTDLRGYLTKKRSIQITPQYCCERLITVVLSECDWTHILHSFHYTCTFIV